jgi:hypothetical protein
VLDLLEGGFQFLAGGPPSGDAVKPYPLVDDLVGPVLRVGMPRAPRLIAPGAPCMWRPAGGPSAPSAAQPSWRRTCGAGGGEELQ